MEMLLYIWVFSSLLRNSISAPRLTHYQVIRRCNSEMRLSLLPPRFVGHVCCLSKVVPNLLAQRYLQLADHWETWRPNYPLLKVLNKVACVILDPMELGHQCAFLCYDDDTACNDVYINESYSFTKDHSVVWHLTLPYHAVSLHDW